MGLMHDVRHKISWPKYVGLPCHPQRESIDSGLCMWTKQWYLFEIHALLFLAGKTCPSYTFTQLFNFRESLLIPHLQEESVVLVDDTAHTSASQVAQSELQSLIWIQWVSMVCSRMENLLLITTHLGNEALVYHAGRGFYVRLVINPSRLRLFLRSSVLFFPSKMFRFKVPFLLCDEFFASSLLMEQNVFPRFWDERQCPLLIKLHISRQNQIEPRVCRLQRRFSSRWTLFHGMCATACKIWSIMHILHHKRNKPAVSATQRFRCILQSTGVWRCCVHAWPTPVLQIEWTSQRIFTDWIWLIQTWSARTTSFQVLVEQGPLTLSHSRTPSVVTLFNF